MVRQIVHKDRNRKVEDLFPSGNMKTRLLCEAKRGAPSCGTVSETTIKTGELMYGRRSKFPRLDREEKLGLSGDILRFLAICRKG